jgi:ABC-type multidrug transport system ATPase subunit
VTGWAVELAGVSRAFGATVVLRGVDLRLAPGERLALFGNNGAGKTTLLRILAALVPPSGGVVRVLGLDPRRDAAALRRRIGLVGHATYLEAALTAVENLVFYARLYDLPDPARRTHELLELMGLARRGRDRVGELSRGTQQRVALARALLHDPELLLLDEPDAGLDEGGLVALETALSFGRADRTVILTSHHPERARRLADRHARLEHGRLVWSDERSPAVGVEVARARP